ncbi:MAPEG family protein [Microbulbifer sp. OS29]|uniref:MAPEG family protein n=1 Tax=Microbulbifer okhotskensis TaxID=2926617 RepID=A0A9X2EQ68_9GAMM|nr:MAPEG family protein [Microbulbifer okhotskensis]MCO1336382.1 MAPEG family protein [Microbulbifer okhotskensis]
MEASVELIQPVVALVIWSLVMWVWMYATRLPAIASMKMKMNPEAPAGTQMSNLPPRVRWKADNYNHLMEQPTIFYAIVFSLAFLDAATGVNIFVSWVYVGLRVVHSLVQALTNKIEIRFVIFLFSSISLFILTFNAVNMAFK